jgi:hypothetical protein
VFAVKLGSLFLTFTSLKHEATSGGSTSVSGTNITMYSIILLSLSSRMILTLVIHKLRLTKEVFDTNYPKN